MLCFNTQFPYIRPKDVITITKMDFHCTNIINYDTPITLATKTTGIFTFPIEDVDKLVENCNESKFGKGKEHVLDKEYRNAYSLESKDMSITFNPYAYPEIIENINNLFNRYTYLLLEKINVYKTGGFFKEHMDTPKPNLVGTLVVSLPMDFTGGELQIENETINFSSNKIQWVAFFSDKNHSVLPVLSGTRVTLSYGIYILPVIVGKNITLETRDLIHSNHTHRRLAYGCDNLSVNKMALKGYDETIFNWLNFNGLNPEIRSIVEDNSIDEEMKEINEIIDELDSNDYIIFTHENVFRYDQTCNGDGADSPMTVEDVEIDTDCTIIKKSSVEMIFKSIQPSCYGNDPYTDDVIYHSYYIVFDNPNKDIEKKIVSPVLFTPLEPYSDSESDFTDSSLDI